MIIGDWEVTIQKEVTFKTRPGDFNSPIQKIITYDFKYIPQDYHLVRTIQYITPKTDAEVLQFLTEHAAELKTVFIDTRSV
jgi:hypothetical protein